MLNEDYFDDLDTGFPIEYWIKVYSRGIFSSSLHFQGEILIERKKKINTEIYNRMREIMKIARTFKKDIYIRQIKTFMRGRNVIP